MLGGVEYLARYGRTHPRPIQTWQFHVRVLASLCRRIRRPRNGEVGFQTESSDIRY